MLKRLDKVFKNLVALNKQTNKRTLCTKIFKDWRFNY